jgi:hypothetical protein
LNPADQAPAARELAAVERFFINALEDPGIAHAVAPWAFRIRVFRAVTLYAPGVAGTAYRILDSLARLWEDAKHG